MDHNERIWEQDGVELDKYVLADATRVALWLRCEASGCGTGLSFYTNMIDMLEMNSSSMKLQV